MFKTPDRQRANKQVDPHTAAKADHKCVCEICNCGRHQCPKEPRHVDPAHFDTTHKTNYKPWEPIKSAHHNPVRPYNQTHYDPDALKTNYKRDYTPQKIVPQMSRTADRQVRPALPFMADTEYKDKFIRQPMAAQPPIDHKYTYQQVPGSFNNTTTYKDEFIKHPTPKVTEIRQTAPRSRPLGETGKSTYKEEYLQYPTNTDPSRHPQSGYKHHQTPLMEKESAYQTHYKPYDTKIYEKQVCPLQLLPERPQHTSPGRNHLTYQKDQNRWD